VSVTDSASVADPSSRIVEECSSATEASEETETAATDASISEPHKGDPHELLGKFSNEWLEALDRDDTKCLALFLSYELVHMLSFTETNAAEYAAAMVKKSARTVRRWQSSAIENDGILPESQQGRYRRSGVLWQNEELSKKATEYVRQNAAVKRRPNLTSANFCRWVNDSLLPQSTLEPGFPRKISIETARLWLHHLGFEVMTAKKGIAIDGHERPDVIKTRKLFHPKMTKISFLHQQTRQSNHFQLLIAPQARYVRRRSFFSMTINFHVK
jgi:hypothetical protein